ncbi:MAG TPA: DUF3455 domain-containing protein [Polyangia bacterium]|jgi:hypothetical protein|nr:DUF3455 domain-containing protein [Polyangia bacterium]
MKPTLIERGCMMTLLLIAGCRTGASDSPNAGAGTPAAASTAWLATGTVPAALAVPPGATLKLHDHGVGAQIYTCAATSGANGAAPGHSWALKAPDAKLYDARGVQVGTHGAGPKWTASDGSVATAKKIADSPSPLPDAIPWLLLRVSSTTGAGAFSDVGYVQRLGTVGGKAPLTGCDSTATGTELRVDYTAEYYFYAGGAGAAPAAAP